MAAKKKAAKKKEAPSLRDQLLAIKEPKKLPSAIPVEALPRLVIGGEAFDDALMLGLLRALCDGLVKKGTLREKVRMETTLESRDALALALLRFWKEKEFHGRYEWILDAVFALGADQAILLLATYMAEWPAHSDTGRKRTIRSVPALVATGTDTALLALCGLRQTAVVPTVLEATIEGLERACTVRKTTLSELFDAITPTLGLDANGRRSFDHAGRSFEVMFDDHFEPHLHDGERVTKELPDSEAWASLSLQLREAIRVQSFRFEQDMINGRRWNPQVWTHRLRDHPLLVSYTRRIVWGLYDKDDVLIGAFRTAEDRTLVTREDKELTLPLDARIGVVHPLHFGPESRAQWGTHLADYEIIQPFAQLGRTLLELTEEEKSSEKATAITRYASAQFKSGVLRDVLVKKGWDRDPSFHRMFYQRNFGHDGVYAIANMDPGVQAGQASYDVADQTIPTIEFHKKRGGGKAREAMPIREVPPVVLSEALLDLADVIVEQDAVTEP